MTLEEAAAWLDQFKDMGDPNVSAVDDLIAGAPMRYVLDACVAVAAVRAGEPTHLAAASRVARVVSGLDTVVVPAVFRVEVASALTRAGWKDAAAIHAYVNQLMHHADVLTMGPRASRNVQMAAMGCSLRAADAQYAWAAMCESVPLVTSDKELLARAGGVAP